MGDEEFVATVGMASLEGHVQGFERYMETSTTFHQGRRLHVPGRTARGTKLEAQLLGMVDSPGLACHAPSLVSI